MIKEKKCPVCNSSANRVFSQGLYSIYICGFCRIGFLSPIPTNEFLKSFYDENYFNKDHSKFGYKSYEAISSSLENEALRKVQFMKKYTSNKSLHLDIGSGPGDFAIVSRKVGFKSEVLDISVWAIKKARKMGLKGYVSDLSDDYSVPKKKYEIITAWDVIEHFNNPVESMKSISRLMSKGSLFFITTPNLDSLDRKVFGRYWYGYKKIPEHIFYFSPQSLRYLGSLVSLELIEVKSWGFVRELGFVSNKLTDYNKFLGRLVTFFVKAFGFKEKKLFFPLVDMIAVYKKI